jgi:DNA-binding NarL/FixJ family response regulator
VTARLSSTDIAARSSEMLKLLVRGLSNKEIGDELCLSIATVTITSTTCG